MHRHGIFSRVAALVATVAAPLAMAAGTIPDRPDQVRPLLVGAEVPQLTLTGADGKPFDLGAATREQRSILVFYRGGW